MIFGSCVLYGSVVCGMMCVDCRGHLGRLVSRTNGCIFGFSL